MDCAAARALLLPRGAFPYAQAARRNQAPPRDGVRNGQRTSGNPTLHPSDHSRPQRTPSSLAARSRSQHGESYHGRLARVAALLLESEVVSRPSSTKMEVEVNA